MKIFFTLLAMLMVSSTQTGAQRQGQAKVDSLLQTLSGAKDDTNKVHTLNKIAMHLQGSSPQDGIRYGNQGLKLAQKLDWEKGIAEAYNAIGANYQGASVFDTAELYYQQAMSINMKTGNKKGAAQNLGNLGIAYYYQSDYPKALDYLFKALKIFEEIDDKLGIATQFGNIASIYDEQNNYSGALKYDSLALRQYRELGDKDGMAIQLGNMGNIYDNIGNPQQALANDLEALHIYEELGSKEGMGRNLSNLSQVYAKLKDDPKTFDCLNRALKLQQEMGDQNGLGNSYYNLASFYLKRGKDSIAHQLIAGVPEDKEACIRTAVDYAQKAIAIHSEVGNVKGLAEEHGFLATAYAAVKDYKNALAALTKYQVFKDSVFSIENNIKMANIETRRAIDLKDKQIELDRLAVAKKRNERVFFIIGILLLTGATGIVFRNYRVQKGLNSLLSIEKGKVEVRTAALDITNRELNETLANLKAAQQQLIVAEKLKENELIRSRISQDIHDDISSELTRISWVSELAKAKMKKDDYKDMPGLLEKITDSSRETVTKLGEIIWTVNPQNDTLARLLAYMRNHIDKFFADTAFRYAITFPDTGTDVHINPELKRNLYLVMKEALNNVVKYSGAEQVDISLSLKDNNYVFCITDNGKGIEAGVVHGGGNGLGNMRKRMNSVKGVCEISSAPGEGTRICCSGGMY